MIAVEKRRSIVADTSLPSLADIEDARERIRGTALRTPLVRLNADAPADVYLKLENLQTIGSFKIRGALNALGRLPPAARAKGLLTASAGNMAQGVAWCARQASIPCTVIAPDTAPLSKIAAIERLGGHVIQVPFEKWWETFETCAFPGEEGTFVHAFDALDVMAGNGTIGLEILEDLPDVDAIVIPWGGGGLACGIGAAVRARRPSCRLYAAEVETAAPLRPSLAAGTPQVVDYRPSFVDGIGGKTVFPQMLERARRLLDGSLVASLDAVAAAVRLLAEGNHVVAEGAGACSVACALGRDALGAPTRSGHVGGAARSRVVCVVSGGNIDLDRFAAILAGPL